MVQSVQRFAARSLAMCSHSAREQQSAAAAGVKKIRRGDFGTQPLTFFYILLHSLTKWFWFSFWKQTKVYRMVLCFLHFSAFFLNVSSTTQENMHNDTKWFLIFSWKQPKDYRMVLIFLGNIYLKFYHRYYRGKTRFGFTKLFFDFWDLC